jgi:hypothetical protein
MSSIDLVRVRKIILFSPLTTLLYRRWREMRVQEPHVTIPESMTW